MAEAPLSVDVDESAERMLIGVSGELDLATAPTLRAAMEKAAKTNVPVVRVDLADLSFLDSSGISVLVEARSALDQRGCPLVLHRVNDRIARVLEVAGLKGFFETSDQPAE